jgi:hypothetical protein
LIWSDAEPLVVEGQQRFHFARGQKHHEAMMAQGDAPS